MKSYDIILSHYGISHIPSYIKRFDKKSVIPQKTIRVCSWKENNNMIKDIMLFLTGNKTLNIDDIKTIAVIIKSYDDDNEWRVNSGSKMPYKDISKNLKSDRRSIRWLAGFIKSHPSALVEFKIIEENI